MELLDSDDNLEKIKYYFHSKDKVNKIDKRGRSPLHLASIHGSLEIARFLIKKGAKIDFKNSDGQTPLLLASQQGYYEIVKLLLENEADANIKDKKGRTALHAAVFYGYINIVELLLIYGAKINAANKDGINALIFAISEDNHDIVKFLLEHNANPNIQDKNGYTPLMVFAMNTDYIDAIELLIDYGADLNIQTKTGYSALMYATAGGKFEMVKFLLENGANPNLKNVGGKLAIEYANDEEIRLLLEQYSGDNKENKITKVSKKLKISHEHVRKVLSKNLNKLDENAIETFVKEECKGIQNLSGICWAVSSVQFLSPLFNELENSIEVMDSLCTTRKRDEAGASLFDLYTLLNNVVDQINRDYKYKSVINIQFVDLVSFYMIENENLPTKEASFDEDYVILVGLTGIKFDDLFKLPTGRHFLSQTFYLISKTHAMCVRKCEEDYFLFDNSSVYKLDSKPMEFMNNLNIISDIVPQYGPLQCIAILLVRDYEGEEKEYF
jgi:ankyrin repeat protein